MYTELIKIIEGGLNNDQKKVINYSSHLAKKLRDVGAVSYTHLDVYKRQLARRALGIERCGR